MDSWISFWLAELTEPPASPVYIVLFLAFLVLGTLGMYAFRGIPHWIIESRQSKLLRVLAANVAVAALVGASILVLQLMSVPIVSRRVWLGLALLVLALHFIALPGLLRWMTRRPALEADSEFVDMEALH